MDVIPKHRSHVNGVARYIRCWEYRRHCREMKALKEKAKKEYESGWRKNNEKQDSPKKERL